MQLNSPSRAENTPFFNRGERGRREGPESLAGLRVYEPFLAGSGECMLVLTRKPNQAIVIGDNIRVIVVSVDRDQIRLGIEAPRDVSVHRAEVYAEIHGGEGKASAS
jgi:carbon storage regulator